MKSYLYIYISAILFLASCSSNNNSPRQIKPQSIGDLNKIFVVADNDILNTQILDTIEYYFGSPYPVLPQPEPILDINVYSISKFDSLSELHKWRSIVFLVNLNDTTSSLTKMAINDLTKESLEFESGQNYKVKIGINKWAKGQTIFYMLSKDATHIPENISKNYAAIHNKIQLLNSKLLKTKIYYSGVSTNLSQEISTRFDLPIDIPSYYFKAKDEDIYWLRYEPDFMSSNIMIKKLDYESQSQFTKEYLIALRNEIGGKHVSSQVEGSKMIINESYFPIYTVEFDLEKYYILKMSGVWELDIDFMGGPFTTYLILNKKTNSLTYIDEFIYSPGKKKRDNLQKLNYIIESNFLY